MSQLRVRVSGPDKWMHTESWEAKNAGGSITLILLCSIISEISLWKLKGTREEGKGRGSFFSISRVLSQSIRSDWKMRRVMDRAAMISQEDIRGHIDGIWQECYSRRKRLRLKWQFTNILVAPVSSTIIFHSPLVYSFPFFSACVLCCRFMAPR